MELEAISSGSFIGGDKWGNIYIYGPYQLGLAWSSQDLSKGTSLYHHLTRWCHSPALSCADLSLLHPHIIYTFPSLVRLGGGKGTFVFSAPLGFGPKTKRPPCWP